MTLDKVSKSYNFGGLYHLVDRSGNPYLLLDGIHVKRRKGLTTNITQYPSPQLYFIQRIEWNTLDWNVQGHTRIRSRGEQPE